MASSVGRLKKDVLRAYRQIFAVARSWEASEPDQTRDERKYIREEARRLFRMNKDVRWFVGGCFVETLTLRLTAALQG